MASLAETEIPDIRVRTVSVTDDELIVGLMDGGTIAAPAQCPIRTVEPLGTGGSRIRHPLARSGRGFEHGGFAAWRAGTAWLSDRADIGRVTFRE